jgi:hypothetical protein
LVIALINGVPVRSRIRAVGSNVAIYSYKKLYNSIHLINLHFLHKSHLIYRHQSQQIDSFPSENDVIIYFAKIDIYYFLFYNHGAIKGIQRVREMQHRKMDRSIRQGYLNHWGYNTDVINAMRKKRK